MLADKVPVTGVASHGALRRLIDRAISEMARLWACYWWLLRAHVAATNFIPRSSLEDPPEDWMEVMRGPGEHDR